MPRKHALTTGLIAAGSLMLAMSVPSSAQNADEWTVLLDGTSLEGWNQTGDANWRIVDGAAQADMGGGHLVTPDSYTDFVLRVEFWVDEPANSGIFIRCQDPTDPGADSCYEVNIYDTRPDPSYGTGAIVNFATIENMPLAANRWNTYQIIAQGDHLVTILNGIRTVDIRDSTYASGPFTLQYGAGTVKFRRVEIREL